MDDHTYDDDVVEACSFEAGANYEPPDDDECDHETESEREACRAAHWERHVQDSIDECLANGDYM